MKLADRMKLAELRAENERLACRVLELEEALGMRELMPPCFGLTRQESAVLGLMVKYGAVSRERFVVALWGGRSDPPMEKSIDVLIVRIRRKVKPYGIWIDTLWGQGYRLVPAMQARVRELIEIETQQEAA